MKKILIVEDDEKSLYLARFILEKEGYEVIESRDGLEALDNVSKETPDLILMDMQLPKLGGYEATKAIRILECGLRIESNSELCLFRNPHSNSCFDGLRHEGRSGKDS